jgi:homeodomain interacting protein kinase
LIDQTPEEYEAETGIKSEETRKYIFSRLDNIGHMNLPTDHLEGGKLLAVLAERQDFTDLLKSMLTMDQVTLFIFNF